MYTGLRKPNTVACQGNSLVSRLIHIVIIALVIILIAPGKF